MQRREICQTGEVGRNIQGKKTKQKDLLVYKKCKKKKHFQMKKRLTNSNENREERDI